MRRLLAFIAVALLGLTAAGCGGNANPASPSTVPAPPSISLAPGAVLHEMQLPGTSETLKFGLSTITPGKDAKLSVGQNAMIAHTCGGPSGYIISIAKYFVTANGDPSWLDPACGKGLGGMFQHLRAKCEGNPGMILEIKPDTTDIEKVRFYVWFKQSNDILQLDTNRCADKVFEEHLGWKAP